MASKNDLPFKFEMTNGNKEEIDNLILEATYQNDKIFRLLNISGGSAIDSKGTVFYWKFDFRSFL